jgi:hypothetical protein
MVFELFHAHREIDRQTDIAKLLRIVATFVVNTLKIKFVLEIKYYWGNRIKDYNMGITYSIQNSGPRVEDI